jgi:hypothetical protein
MSEMYSGNIHFELTALASYLYEPYQSIFKKFGHLFHHWFTESILPVNHRWLKRNTSQRWRNIEREGGSREGGGIFGV